MTITFFAQSQLVKRCVWGSTQLIQNPLGLMELSCYLWVLENKSVSSHTFLPIPLHIGLFISPLSDQRDRCDSLPEVGMGDSGLKSDSHFPIRVLFNMAYMLLEGRGANSLVEISRQIPMQLAEADMNRSHCLCTWQCTSTASKGARAETAGQINSGKTPDKCLPSLESENDASVGLQEITHCFLHLLFSPCSVPQSRLTGCKLLFHWLFFLVLPQYCFKRPG